MSLIAFARAPLRSTAAVQMRCRSAPIVAASASAPSLHVTSSVARAACPRASLHSACAQSHWAASSLGGVRRLSSSSGSSSNVSDPSIEEQTEHLIAQLQSLQSRPDADSASVEHVASSFSSAAWTRKALHMYLGCYDIVPDAAAALAGFARVVQGSDVVPLPQSYAKLVRAVLYDWTPHHSESLERVRAEMLSRTPPLRFTSSDVGVMLPSVCTQPAAAQLLMRWTKEDGVWEKLQPPVQRRLVEACNPRRR